MTTMTTTRIPLDERFDYVRLANGALARCEANAKIAVEEYRANLAREQRAEERRIARRQPVEHVRQDAAVVTDPPDDPNDPKAAQRRYQRERMRRYRQQVAEAKAQG